MGRKAQGQWVKWRDSHGAAIGLLRLTFEEHEGRMECIGLEVRSIGTLTASMLRGLRLAEEADKQRRVFSLRSPMQAALSGAEAKEVRRLHREWTGKRGRRRYGPEHFAEVARVYREAYAKGRTPTRAVARHFDVTQATAAKWVARCRSPELGLLPPTTRGKPQAVKPRRKP